jgi:hypothetical protein
METKSILHSQQWQILFGITMNKNILLQANKLLKEDGLHDTFLSEIKLFKTTTYEQKTPLVYDSKNYLVVPTTLPLECETYASQKEPFICMIISIDKKVMNEIIKTVSKKEALHSKKNLLGIFSDKVTDNIENLCLNYSRF